MNRIQVKDHRIGTYENQQNFMLPFLLVTKKKKVT